MKYLQDYKEQAQTDLFNKTGSFFAFSGTQFKEGTNKVKENSEVCGYVEGDKWTEMGAGLFTLSKYVDKLINDLDTIQNEAIAQDLKENGINNIVLRELGNYECYYTGDITSAFDELKQYGVTVEQVQKKFTNKNYKIELQA